MSFTVVRESELSQNIEMEHTRKKNKWLHESHHNGGIISESFRLGDVATLPLIFLDGEMQQREFHKPGLAMGSINILEENDPNVIKKYLSGFIDLPNNLLNASSGHDGEESIHIDLEGCSNPEDISTHNKNTTWSVREVAVSPPNVVYGGGGQDKKTPSQKEDPQVNEATMASVVTDRPNSAMYEMIDEFSMELERKLKDSGMGDFVLPDPNDFYESDFWKFKRVRKVEDEEEEPDSKKNAGARPHARAQPAMEDRSETTTVHVMDSDGDYMVDEVLLIYNNGTLLFHARRQSDVQIDDDLFSGMLTAVKDFIRDSFRTRDSGGLKRMDFGASKVLIEYGQNVYLTTVLKGGEPVYLPLYMMQVLKEVEEKYRPVLEKWDGRLEKFVGINDVVTKLLEVTNESIHDIEGFESGAVASTIRLIEKAKNNGMPASNPEIFARNITRAIEREGCTNAWDYLKKTEGELIRHFGDKDTRGDVHDTAEPEDALPEPDPESDEADNEMAELEHTINGIVELMDELDSEKRGTDEERAKLREMVQELENRMMDYGDGAEGTDQGRSELIGVVGSVLEKMNELKMDKMDADMEKAELEGAIKGIEDKITDFEISQIGTEAERTELKRLMDGIEEKIAQMESGGIGSDAAKSELKGAIDGIQDKINELALSQMDTEVERTELKNMMDGIEDKIIEMESGNMETEVAKAELEGMIKGIEDKMTDFEISQIGTDAERTEMQRMVDLLQDKMMELEEEKKREIEGAKAKMEDMVKGVEDKMAEMEIKIQGTEDKMGELVGEVGELEDEVEELGGEMEVRRFTLDYIENLDDTGELEALCEEAGLVTSGSVKELKNRLLQYVEGRETDSDIPTEPEDERFTKESIEKVATRSELVALCEEAGLKKSGRKEELRERLLEYVKKREADKKTEHIGSKHPFRMEGVDNLVYAVMGDMYKHLSMELGDSVQEFAGELEIFLRAVLETREELGMGADDMLKSVVIKPYNDRTGEVISKLKTEFLSKVKAENLEVVGSDKEWEGIKLIMEPDIDLIATTFKTQATKIQMLLRLQAPQKIKKILEEKGEYSLGVEGYMVTITPEMLTFRTSTPGNFEIKELTNGIVYIDREAIIREDEEEPPPPPPEPEDDIIAPEPVQHTQEAQVPSRPRPSNRTTVQMEEPPPPSDYFHKSRSRKKGKRRIFGKLKKRISR